MEQLKISIVTPSFNQGKFIEQTILSVLNQGYENLEYIIIDGGSTDESVEIIKKYESRLTYWVSEPDNGQTDAINKGFSKCTGEVIAWINSDDVYCMNSFKNVANYFVKNSDAAAVVGNCLFMNEQGKAYVRKHPNISPFLEKHCMMSILQPSTFLRRKVLSIIGFLDPTFEMMMDAEWYYRINRKFPFKAIDHDLAQFRWHKESKSSSAHDSYLYKKYIREHLAILQTTHPKLKGVISVFPKLVFKAHIYAGFGFRYYRRFFNGQTGKTKDSDL